MMMRMKLAKIIVAAVAVATVIPACSPKKEVDPETFKQSYNQVVMNLARRNYNRALELADSCLNLISKDTSQYYIGLQNAVGMACMELRDSIRSKNAFEASLKMVEKRMRLTDTINYRDVFMKANTMAYLGKKAEALQYIEQYTFPEYELRRFFGRQPADFIKSFNHGPRTPDPRTSPQLKEKASNSVSVRQQEIQVSPNMKKANKTPKTPAEKTKMSEKEQVSKKIVPQQPATKK